MKKFLLVSLLLTASLAAVAQPGFSFNQTPVPEGAQPARQFTLDLTPDGAAQMVVYLPKEPSGRGVVQNTNLSLKKFTVCVKRRQKKIIDLKIKLCYK